MQNYAKVGHNVMVTSNQEVTIDLRVPGFVADSFLLNFLNFFELVQTCNRTRHSRKQRANCLWIVVDKYSYGIIDTVYRLCNLRVVMDYVDKNAYEYGSYSATNSTS